METAAEIKILARAETVPLDLLVRSNLVQQELTRLGINSKALLIRTVIVAPDVMRKLRHLLEREVDRHDREWMETMQRLTITEKTEKRPVIIRGRDVERDCRLLVNQLVTSMPKDVFLRTLFTERGKPTPVQVTEEVRVKSKSSFTRKVRFTDAKEEYDPSSDCSSGDKTMSGESDTLRPVQDDLFGKRLMRPPRDRNLSGESDSKRRMDRALSGESRNITTDWNMMMGNHSAQVMTRDLSPGTTHPRLLPILMYRRLRFIPCWWTGSSAGWTEKCIRIRTETGTPPMSSS